MLHIIKADYDNTLHAGFIVELMDDYAQDEMGGGEALTDFVKENLVKEMQKRPHLHTFIALESSHAIGLINLVEGFSTFSAKPLLNIHDVIVKEGYRGQGVSRKLFEASDEFARGMGCCKLTLEVLEKNEAAQRAYRAFGYEPYRLDDQFGIAQFWHKKL